MNKVSVKPVLFLQKFKMFFGLKYKLCVFNVNLSAAGAATVARAFSDVFAS